MNLDVEILVQLNKQYAREAISKLARNENPSLLHILGGVQDAATAVVDALPSSLHSLVFNGENAQAAFAQLGASYLTKGTPFRQSFKDKYKKSPQVVVLVTVGQRLTSAPTAKPCYESVLLIILQSSTHQLLSYHDYVGSMAVFNPEYRISRLTMNSLKSSNS